MRRGRGVHRPRVAEAAGRGWAVRKARRVGIDCQGSWNSPSRHALSFFEAQIRLVVKMKGGMGEDMKSDGMDPEGFKRGFYPKGSD